MSGNSFESAPAIRLIAEGSGRQFGSPIKALGFFTGITEWPDYAVPTSDKPAIPHRIVKQEGTSNVFMIGMELPRPPAGGVSNTTFNRIFSGEIYLSNTSPQRLHYDKDARYDKRPQIGWRFYEANTMRPVETVSPGSTYLLESAAKTGKWLQTVDSNALDLTSSRAAATRFKVESFHPGLFGEMPKVRQQDDFFSRVAEQQDSHIDLREKQTFFNSVGASTQGLVEQGLEEIKDNLPNSTKWFLILVVGAGLFLFLSHEMNTQKVEVKIKTKT